MPDKHKLITEIEVTEKNRARKILRDECIRNVIMKIRQEHVINDFLLLFYSWDGRYSRSRHRIEKMGDYILSEELTGIIFGTDSSDGATTRGMSLLHSNPE